ncbi:MAG: HAD hydrolase-like protein [Patescibacteria group bacterium]|nr:HAD hydrolase-like protein [Patescibacteria group bacterium]
MIIIFDLDYTLLDTARFKKDLAVVFDRENFSDDYQKYFKMQGVNFNFAVYLSLLKKFDHLNAAREKELKEKWLDFKKRSRDYLFPGAVNILKHLKQGGARLLLITFGDKEWQAEKVGCLGLDKYFDRLSFKEKDKSEDHLLSEIKNSQERILVVNDNAKEAEGMVDTLGKRAKIFLVNGPYVNNAKHHWPVHKLEELLKINI